MLIQIILILFFLFAILKVLGRWRGGEITGWNASLWIIFWILAGIVVIIPNSTFYVARAVGIGRGADLVVYSALALIFFILFRMTVKMERMNKDITKLTRKMALDKDLNNDNNDKENK